MKHSEFLKLIRRCYEKVEPNLGVISATMEHVGFLQVVNLVVKELWVQKIDEDEDTEELRKQFLHLKKHGTWIRTKKDDY